jgi:predicted transcriptional regulator of viral defense system
MKEAIRKALLDYPVFTVRDLASLLNKKIEYAYLQAYRWKKEKLIHEIEKGKYSSEEDPFLISSWVVWPSYISGWAALHYYHLTEQLPFTIQVITTRRRNKRIINYGNATFELTTIKSIFFCGFKKVVYQQHEIFIAEKEKALIDALATKRMSLAEGIEIIKNNKRKISLKKLFYYAAMIKGLTKKLKEGTS